MTNPIKYNNVIQVYETSQRINSDCCELAIINNGTSDILLNGTLTIPPNQAISFDGKQNELDTTIYNVVFNNTGIQVDSCVIIRKFYNQ